MTIVLYQKYLKPYAVMTIELLDMNYPITKVTKEDLRCDITVMQSQTNWDTKLINT